MQIRRGVFETNSSSTHSICIAKNDDVKFPQSLTFQLGEFGWGCNTLKSVFDKASYIYTAFICTGRVEEFERIVKLLQSWGIRVEIFANSGYYYIDHFEELGEFLSAICADENKLKRYLFSDFSFIITGNDNDDMDVDIKVDYEHDEYYKGN